MNQITQQDINLFYKERKGTEDFVIVEGLHAFKHAYRFGAVFDKVYLRDKIQTLARVEKYAGAQEGAFLRKSAQEISPHEFDALAPHVIRTGLIARVQKPHYDLHSIQEKNYIVVLEDPRDLDNVGAVIRVCAARGVAAVVITGESNPWHVNALRGAAGLHFAQPVFSTESIAEVYTMFPERPRIVCSDEGEDMYQASITEESILIFGTERAGVQQKTKQQADKIIGIPMREGVSSMNLATSVSAILFGI